MDDSALDKVTVYRPNKRHELGYLKTLLVMAGNCIRSRELIWQLFKRDYIGKYKKSYLGLAWVVLAPIIGVVSWVFLKSAGLLNPGDVGIPYPAYVLMGTSMWGLFMGCFTQSSETLSSVSGIITQVNFPREAVLLKQMAMHLSNFLVALALNLIVLLIFGIVPSGWTLLLPLVILPLLLLSMAFGLMVSLVSVVAVDIKMLVNAALGLVIFIIPIIYSDNTGNALLKGIIRLNPLTYLVCSARDIIIYGRLYSVTGYVISSVLSLLFFLVVCRLFFVSEDKIIERLY